MVALSENQLAEVQKPSGHAELDERRHQTDTAQVTHRDADHDPEETVFTYIDSDDNSSIVSFLVEPLSVSSNEEGEEEVAVPAGAAESYRRVLGHKAPGALSARTGSLPGQVTSDDEQCGNHPSGKHST